MNHHPRRTRANLRGFARDGINAKLEFKRLAAGLGGIGAHPAAAADQPVHLRRCRSCKAASIAAWPITLLALPIEKHRIQICALI